ncbi:hypothetical protein, partial [Roseivivax isoporae]|uniref:hypothetical protein n=1 Tax=Roseivivax isoporae TaxID=591206 RepID=UPI0005C20200
SSTATYEVQVRFVRGFARVSDWMPDPAIEITPTAELPAEPSDVTATGEPARIRFTGTAGRLTTGFRIFRGATSDFGAATDITGVLPATPLAGFDIISGDANAAQELLDPEIDDGADWIPTGGFS